MAEVHVPAKVASLLVLNGHAKVAPDGVLDLTPAGVKWLTDWLDRQRDGE